MAVARGVSRPHPVHTVHRAGAGLLGAGLWVFAALGFANGLDFFSTQGAPILGLSSNGLLSTISVVAGAVLVAAAAVRAQLASTVTAVVGGLFVLSGIAHLAILHTSLNILAFGLSNVFFSLIAGMLLLFLGTYGRVAGGLPPDNPYRRDSSHRTAPDSPERAPETPAQSQEMREAEIAMGDGHPTPRQQALVERELIEKRAYERRRAWRLAGHGGGDASAGNRLAAPDSGESRA